MRGKARNAYGYNDFARVVQLLEGTLAKCGQGMPPEQRHALLNELAGNRYNLGDEAGCLKTLEPLKPLALRTDTQIRVEDAPGTIDERLRNAEDARLNLRQCSQPR